MAATDFLPIIPVVGQIADTLIQGHQSKKNVERTIKANKELAQYAYSKDLEMWNRQNQYNNPVSQMERLKIAGLNPNMIYGSGSSVGNTSGQMPKYNAPTVDYNQLPPVQIGGGIQAGLDAFNDFRMKNAQVNLIKQQIANAEQTWFNLIQTRHLRSLDFEPKAYKSDVAREMRKFYSTIGEYNLQAMRLKNEKVSREIKVLENRGILSDLEIDWYQFKRLGPLVTGVASSLLRGMGRYIGQPARMKGVSGQFKKYGPGLTPGMKNYKPVW